MALDFPLGTDQFARKLRVREFNWYRRDFVESSGTARGEIITSEIAAPKWIADVSLASYNNRDADEIQALFEAVLPHGRFFLYNIRRPYPASDPDGSILGDRETMLQGIGSNNVSLRISDLPPNFILTRGDMIAFNRGPNGSQRSLHRVVDETAQAGAGGLSPFINVRPAIKYGSAAGVRVYLKKPSALMMVAPGSFANGVTHKMISSGLTFQAIEAPV